METIAIPITLLISVATFLITVGGVWFVTQKRVRDLEVRADRHDQKFDQIIIAIGDLRTDMGAGLNGLRTDITAGLNGLRTDMDTKIDGLRTEMNGLRVDMAAEVNGLRAEINGLRVDMTAEVNGLRADMTAEVNGLRTDMTAVINDVKVEVAKVQGSNMALNEKFDLFLQGRLIPAATQPPSIVAA